MTFGMNCILGALKDKRIRASAQTGFRTAAVVPSCGFTAVDNSTGASRVAPELSATLGAALDQLNLEDDLVVQLTAELDRLDSKVAEYSNSSVAFCSSAEPWECDRTEAELIKLAWDCTAKAYGTGTSNELDRSEETGSRIYYSIPSSASGSIKATTCTVITAPQQRESGALSGPYLVIAVRGSACKVDHIVNLHSEPRDAKVLFRGFNLGSAVEPFGITVNAHAGFLNSALELMTLLSTRLEEHLKRYPSTNILFTGHSAGGAVAALLHLSCRAKYASKFENATFSCITFGSPPFAKFMSDRDAMALEKTISKDRVINIVNEYDLVSRADKSYLMFLGRLCNTIGPPKPINTSKRTGTENDRNDRPAWQPSTPELLHIGPVIVLKVGAPPLDTECQTASGLLLSAWKITPEELSRLIFCRLSVHHRMVYRDRIQQLVNGNFNGRSDWSLDSATPAGKETLSTR